MPNRTIPEQLRVTCNKTRQLADASVLQAIRSKVTHTQSHIIGFLYCNRNREVCQRDVEAAFSISRPTASKTLSTMEQAGLIRRSTVVGDARLKKLELTDKALVHIRQIDESMAAINQTLTMGLSPQEQQTLLALLERVEHNAEHALLQLRSGKEITQC